jgi:hypothetical protein
MQRSHNHHRPGDDDINLYSDENDDDDTICRYDDTIGRYDGHLAVDEYAVEHHEIDADDNPAVVDRSGRDDNLGSAWHNRRANIHDDAGGGLYGRHDHTEWSAVNGRQTGELEPAA